MNIKDKIIISTLGPSSLSKNIVQKMDKSGVDIFRINLSHTNEKDYEKICNKVSNWTKKQICPDTEGAQLRTGSINYKNEPTLFVDSNIIISLVGKSIYNEKKNLIPLQINFEKSFFKIGDVLNIDFNSVIVQVLETKKNQIKCRVISGGLIGSNKGIDFDRAPKLSTFTIKDEKIIKIANKLRQKTVFLSFCSSGNDIIDLRKKYSYKINIIAKIENYEGLLNINEICNEANAILIDRGDLSRVVPIEKIAFVQKEIIKIATKLTTPVFIATNLMESMISRAEPTRAEVNDIVACLDSGAAGLVLAAETAIGKFPVKCVRTMRKIISEHSNNINLNVTGRIKDKRLKYFTEKLTDDLISPHGGELIEIPKIDNLHSNKDLPVLNVDSLLISDMVQMSQGVYSPISKFMNLDEMNSVITKNIINKSTWTMPILFQVNDRIKNNLYGEKEVLIVNKKTKNPIGILELNDIQTIYKMNLIAKKWFKTDDVNHPGVKFFFNRGNNILSGQVKLFKNSDLISYYNLSPRQTRIHFSTNHWKNIIGFHTRNLCHSGHLFIQKLALEETNADAIFLSPVTGIKKSGDFKSKIIIDTYELLIKSNTYAPFGALVGSFNTYSRYSGPREAIFTALCRKNYGCNYFIVGRDHTGVGSYYNSNESQNIFKQIETGIHIIKADKVSYCNIRKSITSDFSNKKYKGKELEISGSLIRDYILKRKKIPSYLISSEIKILLESKYKSNTKIFFEK